MPKILLWPVEVGPAGRSCQLREREKRGENFGEAKKQEKEREKEKESLTESPTE